MQYLYLFFLTIPISSLAKLSTATIEKNTRKAFDQRITEDRNSDKFKYSFIAHKPFYILPYSYSFNPTQKSTGTIDRLDNEEVKF